MQFSSVQDSLQWDPFRAGDTTVSERAVLAGGEGASWLLYQLLCVHRDEVRGPRCHAADEDGKPVYVGRVKHKKGWLLGKASPLTLAICKAEVVPFQDCIAAASLG